MKLLLSALAISLLIPAAHAQMGLYRAGEWTPMPAIGRKLTQAECSPINLTEKMGPVKNQVGDSGYAYAAADLIDFAKSEEISAQYLALTTMFDSGNPIKQPIHEILGLNGGTVEMALDNAFTFNACLEKDSTSSLYVQGMYYLRILETYTEAENAGCKKIDLIRQPNKYFDALKRAVSFVYPELNSELLAEAFQHTTRREFLAMLTGLNCEQKRFKLAPQTITNLESLEQYNNKWYYRFENQRKLVAHINQTLNKKRPIAITFEKYGVLTNKLEEAGLHSAIIAGRVWRDNQCVFIVKNSYGTVWKVPEGVKALGLDSHPGYFGMTESSVLGHAESTTSLD